MEIKKRKQVSLELLDNPVWHALNSHHRHLALRGVFAARYQPGILFAGAMPEHNIPGFDDLKNLIDLDEIVGVIGPLPGDLPGWEIEQTSLIPQMVCEDLKPALPVEIAQLTQEDVPEILELIAIAQPGPFQARTIEMGHYFGIRQNGKLVAMAGERLHLTGFCEVSAVCTHPDHRSRGYAGALTTRVSESIIARGETPFLHVAPENEVAIRLYQKLGFRLRKEVQLNILKKLPYITTQ